MGPAVIENPEGVERLHARIGAAASTLARAHADLVDVTAEALAEGLWAEGGIRSVEHWLQVRAGLSPARAREIAGLARRAVQLPATIQAMREGRLGVDQAAVIAKHVPTGYDRSSAEFAELATVTQLRRSLPAYGFDPVPSPIDDEGKGDAVGATDTSPEDAAYPDAGLDRPHLTMGSSTGRFFLRFDAPTDVGAIVEQAIREATDAVVQAGVGDATLADGLVEVASRSLESVASASRAARFQVQVHINADTGAGWVANSGNTPLPAPLVERVTCNGRLRPVYELDGIPIKLGRSQRVVPTWLRSLILARDGGCRFPGCGSRHHLDVHHIVHWSHGGPTDPDNLVALCGFHHDRHHEGDYRITGQARAPGGVEFSTRNGWPLGPVHDPDPPPPADAPPAWSGPTGETLHTHWLTLTPDP